MADLSNRDELEKELARKLGKLNRVQLARLMEVLGDPPRIENVPPTFWDEVGKEFLRVLSPFLESVYLTSAQQLMSAVPSGVDWALVNQGAVDWARRYTFDLVRGINQTSQGLLQDSISAFYEQGLTVGDLHNKLTGAFGPVRSEMIATTEITRANVEGGRALANDLANQGIELIEVWQTDNDELVCPICRPKHLKPKGDGWTERDGPPAHPRCRCDTSFELPKVRA